MISNTNSLPNSETLNISTLSRLFDNTTNSYKYLFFLAILDILHSGHFDNSETLLFRDIAVEMLANAWYPHTYFKLSFGVQDMISQKLDSLNFNFDNFDNVNKNNLKQTINQYSLKDIVNGQGILRFVPFRLIRPFFTKETQGIKDYHVNSIIVSLSNQNFDNQKILYKFNSDKYEDCDSIILHSEWVEYFRTNYKIIRGWLSWQWLKYMQRCNPNTPGLANKLFPLEKRESLIKQRKYWTVVMRANPIKCIYSQENLTIEDLSLDHYLPWSFVTHDQLWNLIPTNKIVNSSKSNNLPSHIYLDKFIELQHLGLVISHQQLPQAIWYRYIESFLLELRLSNTDILLELNPLKNAYKEVIDTLISLATIQGFIPDWTYSSVDVM